MIDGRTWSRPLVLEGPNGAGKSILAAYLSDRLEAPIRHAGGRPVDHDQVKTRLVLPLGTINDRWVAIGERVYGPILRNGTLEAPIVLREAVRSVGPLIVYCRTAPEVMLKNYRGAIAKEHDPLGHKDSVIANFIKIVNAYDRIIDDLDLECVRLIRYDYQKVSLATTEAEVRRRLCAGSS